jgi:hypothetical protein
MFFRFQIAGEALAIAALSASAVAQNPQAPINTLTHLEAALQACWVPPPMEQSRPGMQIYSNSQGSFFNRGKRRIRNARHTASPWRKRSNDVRLCRSRRRSETP